MRYLYQFGHCMSAAQKQTTGGLTKPQNLLGHGTLNHAILRASSSSCWHNIFLRRNGRIGVAARDLHFGATDGNPQAIADGTNFRFYQSGNTEWLSPTYAMLNIFPLLNLIDFVIPAIRKLARRRGDTGSGGVRAHSFHGVIVPPLTRKNFDQRNAIVRAQNYVPSISQHVLWYYYGEPVGLGGYDFRGTRTILCEHAGPIRLETAACGAGTQSGHEVYYPSN